MNLQQKPMSFFREGPLGEWKRACRNCYHELVSWSKLRHVGVSPPVKKVLGAIAKLDADNTARLGAAEDQESPIFLLSTGWRAGSTLLQRILVTDPSLLMWGEPLGEMMLLSRLTEMMGQFINDRNLYNWRSQPPLDSPSLWKSWIAILYPSAEDFRSGLRSVFDRWMCQPARKLGFTRWGFKEVRIGAAEAVLLHWLYPNARFIVLSRHPYDCYRSFADANWGQIYERYPELPIDSAAAFARHWNRLAESWSELPSGFPVVSLKYEDLISGKVDWRELESWLGIEIQEGSALSLRVGGTARRSSINWCERLIISREAAAGMRVLGYSK